MSLNDINSLSHTKWNCKYHIVFAPKYRRKVFYHERREAVGKILRQLCDWKGKSTKILGSDLVLQIRVSVENHQCTLALERPHKLCYTHVWWDTH